MRRLLRSCVVATALLAFHVPSHAQSVSTAPVYHGELDITPAKGSLNRKGGGVGVVKVLNWRFKPVAGSNGVFPSTERVVINIGDGPWALDPGSLVESKKGGVWTYKPPKGKPGARAITMLRVKLQSDGSYLFSFRITGADMSQLNTEDPLCEPFAFIIGDDDAFSGILFTSPSFTSSKLRVTDECTANAWPWA